MDGTISAAITALFEGTQFHGALRGPHRRRKLWEIPAACHCAVIGTCLPMAELRKLAQRAGLAQWRSASDYALHHSAVGHARERSVLSRLIHKELERRYRAAATRMARIEGDDALRAQWRESLARGEVAPALWALVTHPGASREILDEASQELHMLSHQVGASNRADLRKLSELDRENASLRERLAQQVGLHAAQSAERDARITLLEQRVAASAGLQRRLEEIEARARRDAPSETQTLRARLDEESQRARRAEERLARLPELEARCDELERARLEALAELESAERALGELLAPASGRPPCSDLRGRCVVYVGGRTGMVERYRSAVERFGGRFMHHDGGQEDAPSRLRPMLASADAAVCASGFVSHAAYYMVKRFCKRTGTPCVLLRKGSLASFVQALDALAVGALGGEAVGTLLPGAH